jgi:hypothetical protein
MLSLVLVIIGQAVAVAVGRQLVQAVTVADKAALGQDRLGLWGADLILLPYMVQDKIQVVAVVGITHFPPGLLGLLIQVVLESLLFVIQIVI